MSSSESEDEVDRRHRDNYDNNHKGDRDNQDQDHHEIEPPDDDTIRIIVSTDNHLGYCERDAVRGYDSFCALEEVLYLARHYQADLVLLAGDLFHDNKPSRRTLYKTMQLFRKYCMGPNPIQIQVRNPPNLYAPLSVSSPLDDLRAATAAGTTATNTSSTMFRTAGHANYESPYYSVDLPIFAIHGNHDDPTRDGVGGTELLAALDLLEVANLVNYMGRQDQVNQIQVEPVLIQKGTTKLALYGMGSLRDERLNRMWQGNKVKFLRTVENDDKNYDHDDEGEKDEGGWFNVFALHQNRDLGRGTKNCIHESMIPEWMDLIVWGHEHECNIEPQESVVGTFRITQPGSSVATSLTAGEAQRKHIGILDIRGSNFRLLPIPLTQVRSFVMGELHLADQPRLDPDDPKVDQKIQKLLEDQVRVLIHNARENTKETFEAAYKAGNVLAKHYLDNQHGDKDPCPLLNSLQRRDEVLVRIKVEHSGFSTVNNQRFGAKFVGQVANPVRYVWVLKIRNMNHWYKIDVFMCIFVGSL